MHKKAYENFKSTIHKEKGLTLTNISVMCIALVIMATFLTIGIMLNTVIKNLEQQAQVTVFFKDEYLEPSIMELKASLEKDERIKEVQYVSKQQAFEIFKDLNKSEPILMELASANILPASLEIKTKAISDLEPIAEEMRKKDGVEEVKFFKEVIQQFKNWSTVVYSAVSIITVLVLLVAYGVILATIRLTINSKGKELEILKLVGASNDYVKQPLMYQGVFYGLSAAILTSLLLLIGTGVTYYFNSGLVIQLFFGLTTNLLIFWAMVSAILVLSGAAISYLGTSTAIKKYLKY